MDDPGLWTLDELAEQVGAALSVDYPGAPSGRVRSVPDRRAIRWYTTIGLVDRPASMRGRTALYGERHLLQLVAIKRLQAEGRSLADIQAELAGATESTLRSLARLPDRPPEPATPAATPRNDRFWSAAIPPASSTLPAGGTALPDSPAAGLAPFGLPAADAVASARAERSPTVRPAEPRLARNDAGPPPAGSIGRLRVDQAEPDQAGLDLTRSAQAGSDQTVLDQAGPGDPAGRVEVAPAIALPGGVTVLLPPGTPYPRAADLHAIRTAALPLLAELSRCGVIATDYPEERP